MIDWQRSESLLLTASENVLSEFLLKNPVESLCAIGYVFELWNNSAQFDLCVNTRVHFDETRRGVSDPASVEETRWNSGDFVFPAGLPGQSNHLSWQAWTAESDRLHTLADQEQHSMAIYEGLLAISCIVMARLASRGLFGDWSKIDFNVSEVGDAIDAIKRRDFIIRSLVADNS